MIRQRVRIRFRKEGDLRYIGHRDLVRAFERILRRAGLQLSMSEGFHPKAKMSFPLALSVGIGGDEEVLEAEFSEMIDEQRLHKLLQETSPPGIVINQVEVRPPNVKKAQVAQVAYTVPVTLARCDEIQAAITQLTSQSEHWVERAGNRKPVDVLADLETLECNDGVLTIRQRVTREATANVRDILGVIGLADIEREGNAITRSEVQLAN